MNLIFEVALIDGPHKVEGAYTPAQRPTATDPAWPSEFEVLTLTPDRELTPQERWTISDAADGEFMRIVSKHFLRRGSGAARI